MDESVLSLFVNFMTDIKLDNKILYDETYQELLEKEDACEEDFKKMLTNDQLDTYVHLSELIEERAARYHILAYQQGMKDLLQFLTELTKK